MSKSVPAAPASTVESEPRYQAKMLLSAIKASDPRDELVFRAENLLKSLSVWVDVEPNFCESCAMAAATCDCVNPKHIWVDYAPTANTARPARSPTEVAERRNLIADLRDLHKQATVERSHHYAGAVILRAIAALERL